ncbi:C39 family peptidase [Oxynema aestuarii]|uniref:C39 family peptidase n=1 Tax=Oxynema aestuarii AP17 TaxID=2064643 RepID=A0A6H1TW88_9CYAN|nr:C39 family peptidase [Oxynema aestuarii]QIZ70854.1 C39 family peptidase [Oxynema aestuarii AP17]RMH72147.1 MAG: hypothetical protein D6680_19950 [Cyanobacteria bacterium J007]
MSISLVNVFQYYEDASHQAEALQYLQQELERSHPELLSNNSEFIEIWRNPEPDLSLNSIDTSGNGAAVATAVTPAPAATATRTATATVVETKPKTVHLPVPYLTQLDNVNNPHGSCNVTCVAMCLGYFNHPLKNSYGKQLEDELYEYCLNNGLSRHSPTDLQKLIQIYGYKDDFQPDAKWGDVKKWLDAGNPCISHGWFTRSGHIIAIVGYNEKGWIVNDPYGEWFSWGYDTTVSGKGLTYSYGMMKKLCGPDGDNWIHFVSK